jgi:hypothetical protein
MHFPFLHLPLQQVPLIVQLTFLVKQGEVELLFVFFKLLVDTCEIKTRIKTKNKVDKVIDFIVFDLFYL